jgi:hypothetical protein
MTTKFPPEPTEHNAGIFELLEAMSYPQLLKVARVAIDNAQDCAEACEENPEAINQLVTAYAALEMIFARAFAEGS